MYQPGLYIRNNDLQRRDINKVLHNSMKLIKWSGTGTEMVVDLGCGSGDVTKDVILANVPNIKGIVGVDVSPEMLKFAREKNAHDMINYRRLNLATKNLRPEFWNQFDHAFSFHVFHWIKDQRWRDPDYELKQLKRKPYLFLTSKIISSRRLFSNIYKMLKPGADMLGFFVVSTDMMLVLKKQATMPKWSAYLQCINDIFPYQHCENPQEAIEDVLNHSGFSHMVKLEKREFIYSNREHFKTSMAAIIPFIKNIPEVLHEEYMDDFADIAAELNSNRDRHNQIGFPHPYILAVVYLRKPDI